MLPSLIKIEQRQADALVVAGDLDDQAQVGLDHLLAGLLVAFLDARGQLDLLLRGQQLDLADLAQVKLDGGVAVISRSLAAAVAAASFVSASARKPPRPASSTLSGRLFLGQILLLGFGSSLRTLGGPGDLLGRRRRRDPRKYRMDPRRRPQSCRCLGFKSRNQRHQCNSISPTFITDLCLPS